MYSTYIHDVLCTTHGKIPVCWTPQNVHQCWCTRKSKCPTHQSRVEVDQDLQLVILRQSSLYLLLIRTVIRAPVGSLISSTFVPLGVVIVQSEGRLVLGTHMMVTVSTVTPGSTHKSQPISKSTIMRNWVVSIGGGGVSHPRTGGPISGGRQLRYTV